MKEHVFRMYDIRGEVGIDFSADDITQFGRATAAYLHTQYPTSSTVAVGRDGRTHSPELHQRMCQAFQESGFTVLDLGVCPTPVVHFALHTLPIDFGLMITASHNGPTYNGCKLMRRDRTLWGEELQELCRWYQAGKEVVASSPGELLDYTDMVSRYVSWLADHFAHLKEYQGQLIFDCGNGATGAVIPQLIAAMGWPQAQVLYAEIDGTFPHHEADPVVAENMRDLVAQVIASAAVVGMGFDGDGDRMGAITRSGKLLAGDQLLLLYARPLLAQRQGASVVYDAKCSGRVEEYVRSEGGVPHMSPSGYAHIRNTMRATDAAIGGELSCHFFFADRYFGYDDGIYAALRLIELLVHTDRTLDALVDALPHSYVTREWRMPSDDIIKHHLVASVHQKLLARRDVRNIALIDGLRVSTDDGWWLLRVSHTQPVICLRCEAYSQEGLQRLYRMLCELLRPHVDWALFEPASRAWVQSAYGADAPVQSQQL